MRDERLSQAPRGRFEALDGFRGVLAVAVAFMHLRVLSHFCDGVLVRGSFLAVDFFFVLSGFVISYTSSQRLSAPGAFTSFAIRRFGRVWPLHAAVLGCLIVVELSKLILARAGMAPQVAAFAPGDIFDPAAIPLHLLLVHSLHVQPHVTWNGPSWSISAEFYTYMVFALVSTRLRAFTVWISGALVLLALLWLSLTTKTIGVTVDLGFVRCIFGFFAGCLVCALPRLRVSLRMQSALELASVLGALVFVYQCAATQASLLAPLVFALVIWVFAPDNGLISARMRSPTLQWLGRLSYSIYIIHDLVYVVARRVLVVAQNALHASWFVDVVLPGEHASSSLLDLGDLWLNDIAALAILAVVLSLSVLTHRWIELPGIALSQRLARRFALQAKPELIDDVRPQAIDVDPSLSAPQP